MTALVLPCHYNDVIMGAVASQITSLTIVYSTVYSGTDQSKHQSSASLAFVWGIHRGPVNSLHKWPVMWKMFPFDDVIMVHNDVSHNKKITQTEEKKVTKKCCSPFFLSKPSYINNTGLHNEIALGQAVEVCQLDCSPEIRQWSSCSFILC